jgi:L-threonylcarbamoyladenylate synthase
MSEELNKAIEVLKKGGVVVYPTDTVYGLAVNATNFAAVKKLYALKGRDFNKPIHIIFPSAEWLAENLELTEPALKLMNQFLPGPLTIVLKLKSKNPALKKISGSTGLGIRWPDHQISQQIAIQFGKPITTTSANASGMPNCYSVADVKKQFAKSKLKPDLYLDGGKLGTQKPSTLVEFKNHKLKILRQGPITEKQLLKALI